MPKISETEIWDRLREVFRRVFRKPDLEIMPETSSWDIPGWDSIAQLQLILGVEKEFGIRFEIREIAGIEHARELAACISAKSAPA